MLKPKELRGKTPLTDSNSKGFNMYSISRFGLLMKAFPRRAFQQLVEQHQGNRYSKGFTRWDQLVALIFGQISGARSLRELEAGFNAHEVHHYHLGTRPIRRSTLADANAADHVDLFRKTCELMLGQLHGQLRRRLRSWLYVLDASPICLAGRGFEWAEQSRANCWQGIKLNLLIEANQAAPCVMRLSPAARADVHFGRSLEIESGATYVFDLGYYDFLWWDRLDAEGARFVTRLKKNARVTLMEAFPIPEESREVVLEDGRIRFDRPVSGSRGKNPWYGRSLRRVTVARPTHKTPLVLVTNDFTRSACEIAELYRRRWEIELFFKWVKQNLKVRQFYGRSENAVRTQLYVALITYALIWMLRHREGLELPLRYFMVLVRSTLFDRPDLAKVLAQRRRRRAQELAAVQMGLAL